MTTTTTSSAATEAPATEAPATQPPATEAPATDPPATAAPATDPPATDAPSTDELAPVKVAFVTKFQVEFFTAMEDAAQAYVDANEGIEIEFFSCASPADVDCQIAQIEDAVVKGFDAMVITPMGNDVIPALDAAADSGLGDRARRQRPRRLHQEDGGRGDRQRGRWAARRRVLEVGPQGG